MLPLAIGLSRPPIFPNEPIPEKNNENDSNFLIGAVASRGTLQTPMRVLGGLLLARLFSEGVRHWLVNDEYEAMVNEQVSDKYYLENIQKLDGWDFLVFPLLGKGLSIFAKWVAPDAMAWADAMDHPELKEAIHVRDAQRAREIEKELQKILLALPVEFLPQLENLIQLNPREERRVNELIERGDPSLNSKDKDLLNRYLVADFQKSGRFLRFVSLPQTQWAREVFRPDGTLMEGGLERLMGQ